MELKDQSSILIAKIIGFPVAVVVFRKIAIYLDIREQLDHWIHFMGGFAITYTIFHLLVIFRKQLGLTVGITRFLLAFSMGCTVALFWEFGELVNDLINNTRIQHDVRETLLDLIYGTLGAVVILIVLAITSRVENRTKTEQVAAGNVR